MNYQAHYDRLVERARNRSLEGYVERHHVIPRCVQGTDDKDNIVLLTPEEHYVAHQLLLKLHPHIPGLAYAAVAMCGKGKTISRNNKSYGWIKQRVSAARKGKPLTAEHRAKVIVSLEKHRTNRKGTRQPQSFKDLQSKRMTANTINCGRAWSEEAIAKRAASNSLAQKGKTLSDSHRAALKEAWQKRKMNSEVAA